MPPFWENQNMENKHIFYLGMHASHNASDNAEITEDVISVHWWYRRAVSGGGGIWGLM